MHRLARAFAACTHTVETKIRPVFQLDTPWRVFKTLFVPVEFTIEISIRMSVRSIVYGLKYCISSSEDRVRLSKQCRP